MNHISGLETSSLLACIYLLFVKNSEINVSRHLSRVQAVIYA